MPLKYASEALEESVVHIFLSGIADLEVKTSIKATSRRKGHQAQHRQVSGAGGRPSGVRSQASRQER
jgi:hypothetical protein